MTHHPAKIEKLTDNLYSAGSAFVSFYLYDTGKSLIAFDTGRNPRSSLNIMKKLNLSPDKVSNVFLTHSDSDHAGGVSLFKNAAIYLSKEEVPLVNGITPRFLSFIYNRRVKNATPLDDRRTIRVDGDYIQIINAPGHTPGSACYFINGKILVVGDLLRISAKCELTPFQAIMNMDSEEDARSLEKLQKEGLFDKAEWVLSGHTGAMRSI